MTGAVSLEHLDPTGLRWAQAAVIAHHYLHAPVPRITRPEGWAVSVAGVGCVGCLLVCRPQATRCYPWYGSVADVDTGRAAVTRWQVLCLARVWIDPRVQPGGAWHRRLGLPGFVDRRGQWRSTLASTALRLLTERVGHEYLLVRPPVFPDQPYEIRDLLSYCDRRLHRGTIYAAAGWERYRVNAAGMETWRAPVRPLTPQQHERVVQASLASERGRRYRAQQAQAGTQLPLIGVPA